MTEEERKALIALLAGQINTGANPLLMSSAYPYNVSPSGVASSFDPEILFASGAVSPETVAAGQQDIYAQLLAEYAKRSQPRAVYEATEQYLRDSLGRYGTGTDPVSDFVQQAAARIAAGDMTPDQILAEGQKSAKDLPKEVVDNWASVSSTLTDFGKKADIYRTAKAKQAFDAQTSMADLGPAPSMTEARMKYFKDLGVPQLAALPDPTEQFNVSSETFIDDRAKYDALQNALRLAEAAKSRAKAGADRDAQYANKQAEVYAAKANEEMMRKAIESAKASVSAPDFTEKAVDFGTDVLSFGIVDLFGETSEEAYKRRQKEAVAAAFAQEMLRRSKQEKETILPTQVNAPYRAAVEEASRAKGRVSQEEAYARLVADAFNKRLAERGVTPYNQAMNSILGYAIQTGRK